MLTARRLVLLSKCNRRFLFSSALRNNSSPSQNFSPNLSDAQQTDDAIPTKPTWSVHALLASYPRPRLTHAELTKLHTLSALVPPVEGSEEAERLREEMEEMIRLVEAVKLVDTSTSEVRTRDGNGSESESESEGSGSRIPDGRILEEGRGMTLSSNTREVEFEDPEIESGRTLLKHAKMTKNGFYVVEADRRKK